MPYTVELRWTPPNPAGLSKKNRASGTYRAYLPDELAITLPELGAKAQYAAEEAAVVLARLDERISSSGSTYLNHLLIRSESISSSWIEGNRLSPKKLAIAERLKYGDRVALDVIANVRATENAIDEIGRLHFGRSASRTSKTSSTRSSRGLPLDCEKPRTGWAARATARCAQTRTSTSQLRFHGSSPRIWLRSSRPRRAIRSSAPQSPMLVRNDPSLRRRERPNWASALSTRSSNVPMHSVLCSCRSARSSRPTRTPISVA